MSNGAERTANLDIAGVSEALNAWAQGRDLARAERTILDEIAALAEAQRAGVHIADTQTEYVQVLCCWLCRRFGRAVGLSTEHSQCPLGFVELLHEPVCAAPCARAAAGKRPGLLPFAA